MRTLLGLTDRGAPIRGGSWQAGTVRADARCGGPFRLGSARCANTDKSGDAADEEGRRAASAAVWAALEHKLVCYGAPRFSAGRSAARSVVRGLLFYSGRGINGTGRASTTRGASNGLDDRRPAGRWRAHCAANADADSASCWAGSGTALPALSAAPCIGCIRTRCFYTPSPLVPAPTISRVANDFGARPPRRYKGLFILFTGNKGVLVLASARPSQGGGQVGPGCGPTATASASGLTISPFFCCCCIIPVLMNVAFPTAAPRSPAVSLRWKKPSAFFLHREYFFLIFVYASRE